MKRSRTRNDPIDLVNFCDGLAELAKLRTPGFDWDLRAYGKSRRSQGPDRDGLMYYERLLEQVLRFAPRGFPSHVQLREAWMWLQKEHHVMACDVASSIESWADKAAETIRLMLKHLVDIRRSGTPYLSPGLAKLVGMISDDSGSSAAVAPQPAPALAAPPPAPEPLPLADTGRRQLVAHDSTGSSVQFCGLKCRCSDCRAMEAPEDIDSADSVSEDAKGVVESVPAARGAVREVLKRPGAMIKRPAGADSPRPGPRVSVARRLKGPYLEAYIVLDNKFFVSQSFKKRIDYLTHIDKLAAMLRAGDQIDNAAARAMLMEWST